MTAKPNASLRLTRRALADVAGILEYSTKQWGTKAAEKYLDDLEAGLD